MTNNFVAMETKICPVCGIEHRHNAGILIHKNLRNINPDKTTTGYGMCEEHESLHNREFLALIEAKNSATDKLKLGEADRTGRLCHIQYSLAEQVFNIYIPRTTALVFVEVGVIDRVQALMPTEESDNDTPK